MIQFRKELNKRIRRRKNPESLGRVLARGAVAGIIGGVTLITSEGVERRFLPSGSKKSGGRPGPAHDVWPNMARDVGMELAYCAALGAAYGLLRSRIQAPRTVHNLALAGLSYAALQSTRRLMSQAEQPNR